MPFSRQQLQSLRTQFPQIPMKVIIEKQELIAEMLKGRTRFSETEINISFKKTMLQLGQDKLLAIRFLTLKYNLNNVCRRYTATDPGKKHAMCDSVINALADGHLLTPLMQAGLRRHELDSGKLHQLVKFNRKLYNRWGMMFRREWIRNVRERTEMLNKLAENNEMFADLIASYSVIVMELRMLVKFSKVIFVDQMSTEEYEEAKKRVDDLHYNIQKIYARAPLFYKLLFVAIEREH